MPNVIYEWASKNCRNHSVLFMGSFFSPPLSFFIPFPTVAALKAGKNRARISRAETKREIFLRDFSRHFPRPPFPPRAFNYWAGDFQSIFSRWLVSPVVRKEKLLRETVESRILFTPVQQADFYSVKYCRHIRGSNVERVLYRACIAETNIYIYWCIFLFVYVYYILLYMYIIICIVDNFITFFDYN